MIRILVVDDQALVRSGFHLILDSEPDFEVVGEAGDGEEAIDRARQLHPDVVLMDVRMPRMDGVEATRRLVADGTTRVLILTTFDLDEHLFAAVRAGASGFLLKDVPPDELASAVRAVARGDALIEPRMTRRLLLEFARQPVPDRPAATPAGLEDQLTSRELEVFHAVARGRSNAEIAQELYLSIPTVKAHIGRLFTKLEVENRVQIALCVHDAGLS